MPVGNRLIEFAQYSELKQLAFNIALLQREKMFHSLAVLSFFPGEGKTLFCATAAMAYADTCRCRVLIIDTTTLQNRDSLNLQNCFTAPASPVDVLTMEKIRAGSNGVPLRDSGQTRDKDETIHEPEVVDRGRVKTTPGRRSDPNLLRKVTEEESKSHGLVLMDTAPLNSRNKSNVDPLVVARQSDASLLIVGQKLLNAADLKACLKIARDPTLRLVGVVSNEEFSS